MLKRLRWTTIGVIIGVVATIWLRRRLQARFDRAVSAVVPGGLSGDAATTVRNAGARLRAAIAAGRQERSRREAELWADLEVEPAHARPSGLRRHWPPVTASGPGGPRRARQ